MSGGRPSLTAYAPSAAAWALTCIYLATAYTYRSAPRAMPLLVGWAVWILLALDLAALSPTRFGRALTSWLNPARETPETGRRGFVRQVTVLGSVGLLAASFALLGVLASVAIYVFGMIRYFGRRSPLLAALAAAALTSFVWVVFVRLLHIELYGGLLSERLAG